MFLVLSLPTHAGLNFNQISNQVDNVLNPFVINDKLIYQDDNEILWISNGISNSSYKPTSNGLNIKARNLLKTDDSVIFINQADNNTLWFFDGENMSQLSGIPLSHLSSSLSNVAAAKLRDSGNFVITDGNDVNYYEIIPLTLNIDNEASLVPSVCAFDNDNLIFKAIDLKPMGSSTNLYSYQSGVIAPIQFDTEEVNGNSIEFVLQSGGYCYYRYFDYGNNKAQHYKIDIQGNVSTINNPDSGYFDEFFVYNDQVLLFENGFSSRKQLYTLSDDSVTPEEFLSSDEPQGVFANSFWSTKNYLYLYGHFNCEIKKCSPPPPNPHRLMVYDKSFNLVNTILDSNLQDFFLESADDKDFLIFRKGVDELVSLNQGLVVTSVKDALVDIHKVIGESQQNYYVYGMNRLTEKQGIYKVSVQAVISQQLAGLWVAEGLQSQGLSIHSGTRPNGSTYLFISLYIYRDGNPFWLAGNTELNTGQTEQTIDLAEYKGQSFLSNNPIQNFEQIPFGNITIKPQNCDSIAVQINSLNSEVIELIMQRVVDISHTSVCKDE